VLDDDFIHWVTNPDEESDQFWNDFISQNPGHTKNIEEAKILIVSLDTSIKEVPSEVKNRLWESITKKSVAGKVIGIKSRRIWMAAASVVVLMLAAGSYFYFNKDTGNAVARVEQVKKPLKNDVAPGGNKAVLTLANGTTIILDSAANGSLASQGNMKIIKLDDGKLAYQQSAGSDHPSAVQFNTVTTPRGGQYQLVLSDGSKVWLNAASSITFPTAFIGKERNVKITGEAYFEVTHNANMPFHVKVNEVDIKVLGTHFNINAYSDEDAIKTTLLEGSVKVSNRNGNTLITPGEQALVFNSPSGNGGIAVKKDVDLDEVVAWKNGYFSFRDASLREVMRQISRWYDVDVQFAGAINDRRFGGEIARNSDLSQVLKILEESKVHFTIEGKKLLVAP
jgi:ferric-dicitrate binding protein FerR (iron transport regulator)